ncbi:EVE domain-containing protein [Xanthomonas arboricola]|uniref:EVE domain-containing protein n=1 Tax=Xanthomonas arboricola TaxID=56448 RepID=UPI000F8C9C20|nr:EVE domain-containing protein [Xanthomonas arboricola]
MSKAWIAVASAEHVRIGREAGFMQVCHGKAAPLRRIRPGDCVIYYSPTVTFGAKERCQAFTAIGAARDSAPYQVEVASGFRPWRRDVVWQSAEETPIRPLLGRLAFAQVGANWGYQLRSGLFGIDEEDADVIAQAMMHGRRESASNVAISAS